MFALLSWLWLWLSWPSIFLNLISSEFPMLSWWFIYGHPFFQSWHFPSRCSWFQLGPERVPGLGEVIAVTLPRTLEEQVWEGPWDGGLLAIYFSGNYKALILRKLLSYLLLPFAPQPRAILEQDLGLWDFFWQVSFANVKNLLYFPLDNFLWFLWSLSKASLQTFWKFFSLHFFLLPLSFPSCLSLSLCIVNAYVYIHTGAHTHV